MGTGPLFGILVQERAPAQPIDWWAYVFSWLQDAGGFAALALFIWLLAAALGSLRKQTVPTDPRAKPVILTFPVLVLGALALVVYVIGVFLYLISSGETAAAARGPSTLSRAADICFAVGGALALVGLSLPFATDVLRLRGRRVWALTRLSFQE